MPDKKASDLKAGDLIHYPADSKEWSEVYKVGKDTRSSTAGDVYVAIEGYGNVSMPSDKVVETKD